jgi:hypothetical protein
MTAAPFSASAITIDPRISAFAAGIVAAIRGSKSGCLDYELRAQPDLTQMWNY